MGVAGPHVPTWRGSPVGWG